MQSYINPFTIYLWGIADDLKSGMQDMFGFMFVAAALALIIFGFAKENNCKEASLAVIFKWFKGFCFGAIFFGVVKLFIPSSKTIAIAAVVPAIVQSKPIQQDLPDIYNMAIEITKQKLQQIIDESKIPPTKK